MRAEIKHYKREERRMGLAGQTNCIDLYIYSYAIDPLPVILVDMQRNYREYYLNSRPSATPTVHLRFISYILHEFSIDFVSLTCDS